MFALASCQMVITFISYISSQLNVPIESSMAMGKFLLVFAIGSTVIRIMFKLELIMH